MPRTGQTPTVARQRSHPVPDHDVRSTAIREWVQGGLWFIPLVGIVLAIAAGAILMQVDRTWPDLPSLFHGDASSAQDLLSTIATSTVALTTLVLSITIVALQLASQQFSPRVMRTFFRDRGTKVSLGIFVSTAVYALFVLRSVVPRSSSVHPFVPGVTISVAYLLALATLVTFVYYLDHVTHEIRVVHIIDAVAAETRAVIHQIPGGDRTGAEPGPAERVGWPDRPPDLVLCSEQPPGVLVVIDEDDLIALAEQCRVRIQILRRVGDYLPSGIPLAEVWSDDGRPPTITHADLTRFTGIGHERSMTQDVAFGFRQLVDIAEKALSPALNDPTTAVQAIDRIHDLLRRLAKCRDAIDFYADDTGTVRLMVPQYRWENFVHLGFDEIRQYGGDSLQVHQRLRAAIEDLVTVVADDPERTEALQVELRALDRTAAANFPDPHDLDRARTPHLAG